MQTNRKARRLFESVLSKLPNRVSQEIRVFFFPREKSIKPYVRVCKPPMFSKKDEALARLAFEKINATVFVAGLGGFSGVVEFLCRLGVSVIVTDPKVGTLSGQLRGTTTQKECGEMKPYGFAKRVSKSLSSGATITAFAATAEEVIEAGLFSADDIVAVLALTDSIESRISLQNYALEFNLPFVTGGLAGEDKPQEGMAFFHTGSMKNEQGCCFTCYQASLSQDPAPEPSEEDSDEEEQEPESDAQREEVELPEEECTTRVDPALVLSTSGEVAKMLSRLLQKKESANQLVFSDTVDLGMPIKRVTSFRPDCDCNPNKGAGGTEPPTTPPLNPPNPIPNNPVAPPVAPQANGFHLH